MDNSERACNAETAVEAFRNVCGTDREDAVQDLICNLMHLAEADGDDPVQVVQNAISHYYAETNHERDCDVEISITPKHYPREAPKYSELKKMLAGIREITANGNSEPDVMAAALNRINDLVAVPVLETRR